MEKGLENNNLTEFTNGLFQDSSLLYQPKGSQRFALNAVNGHSVAGNEEQPGYNITKHNEESNEVYTSLTPGYIPIGQVYVGNNEIVIFSVTENNTNSEIGIMNGFGNYTVLVNDSNLVENNKLEFKLEHQIQAIYRLRRGCERTIYWTDGVNPVRYYIIEKQEDFKTKDENGISNFDTGKFDLFKRYKSIPTFDSFEVKEEGNLKAGSYNFAIQYLDSDLNPTEWISTSKTINIYNNSLNNEYSFIRGSTNKETFYQQFGITSKSIDITVGNLDTSYLFYRIAIIEATLGNGQVNKVTVTQPISTSVTSYKVTGADAIEITAEEVLQEVNIIDTAKSILQIENRLLLGNTTGKQTKFCDLQHYASKIQSACILKDRSLTDVNNPTNSKNPVNDEKGYMPGEIYSFGIVYVFDDGATSPVYHIPGRNENDNRTLPEGRFHMSPDNKLGTEESPITYTDSSVCDEIDYWGKDSENQDLKNTPIRHHRFPTRSELAINFENGLPLVEKGELNLTKNYTELFLSVRINTVTPLSQYLENYLNEDVELRIKKYVYAYQTLYVDNVSTEDEQIEINYARYREGGTWLDGIGVVIRNISEDVKVGSALTYIKFFDDTERYYEDKNIFVKEILYDSNNKRCVVLDHINIDDYINEFINGYKVKKITFKCFNVKVKTGEEVLINPFKYSISDLLDAKNMLFFYRKRLLIDTIVGNFNSYEFSVEVISAPTGLNLTHTLYAKSKIEYLKQPDINSKMLGIEFSNIELPEGVKGYYIVRNERTELDKSILDTGILLPMTEYEKFISFGNIFPSKNDDIDNHLRKDIYALLHPKHLFENKEYKQENIQILKDGYYQLAKPRISANWVEDAQVGTTYDPEYHKKVGKDKDGLTLLTLTKYRDSATYENDRKPNIFGINNIDEIFYLNPLTNRNIKIDNKDKEVYNVSCDNAIGIIKLKNSVDDIFEEENTQENKVKWFYDKEGNIIRIENNIVVSGITNLTNFPYVILKRDIKTSYQNFRYLPYYKEHNNYQTGSSIEIFNGDVHLSPLTFSTTMQYNVQSATRETKKSVWKYILGGLAIVAGVVATVFTLGAGAAVGVSLAVGGLSLMAAAAGIASIISGIEQDKLNKIYWEKYEEGLRDTLDDFTTTTNVKSTEEINKWIYEDDTIVWLNYVLSNLYFETEVNTSLRQGNTNGLPDFINVPTFYNEDELNSRAINKISIFDPDHDNGRLYQGFSVPELYEINPDFYRINKQEAYFHLGLEYDCCSDCRETFPHRIWYSQQSFQEELTDNYRTFLPNNYKDIDGETGEITNLFKLRDQLFVHTREGLWNLPKNIERREISEISSFIGSGSFFENPPIKMKEGNNGMSAGLQHRESITLCEYGYFFVCENQRKIFQFNGQSLIPISDVGMEKWFKDNLKLEKLEKIKSLSLPSEDEYDSYNKMDFIGNDNPSNPDGYGFISAYDSKNERLLITKIDKINNANNSWTISFDLKTRKWVSLHSYIPNMYFYLPNNLFTWKYGNNNIWKHNVKGKYLSFYGTKYPFIIEYVSLSSPLQTRIFDSIQLICKTEKYDITNKEFIDINNVFFNKLIAYNSKQCTGLLNIKIKDDKWYSQEQLTTENLSEILADKNEGIWSINSLRDIRINYNQPIFISDVNNVKVQLQYYIDKVLNDSTLNFEKDWQELEPLRDKYLVVRLIFDNTDDVRFSLDFTSENEKISIR